MTVLRGVRACAGSTKELTQRRYRAVFKNFWNRVPGPPPPECFEPKSRTRGFDFACGSNGYYVFVKKL
jgi:hypothetical protein